MNNRTNSPIASRAPDNQNTLQDILRMLARRKVLIFFSILCLTALAAIVAFQLTPVYSAMGQLAIETRKVRTVNIQEVVSDPLTDRASLGTEAIVLRSSDMVNNLIEKTGLFRDPEFNPYVPKPVDQTISPPGLDRRLGRSGQKIQHAPQSSERQNEDQDAPLPWLGQQWKNLGSETVGVVEWFGSQWERLLGGKKFDTEAAEAVGRVIVEERVLKALSVEVVPLSYAINVSFSCRDPAKAAHVVNTLIDLYIAEQLESKFEVTRKASLWMKGRLDDLSQHVQDAGRAVEKYKAENNLVEGLGGGVAAQQLSELNSLLIQVRAERAEKEARYNQIEASLRSGRNLDTSSDVLKSPLIQRLRENESELTRKLSELTANLGEKHPKIINAQAELQDAQRKIADEVRKIAASLANEVGVIRARETALTQNLANIRGDVTTSRRAEVKLRELVRESETSRVLYENILTRFKETEKQFPDQRANVSIISKASIPLSPTFPKKKFIIIMSFVVSVFLSIGLALLLESLDNGVRTAEQLEQMGVGYVMSLIPNITPNRKEPVENYIVDNPLSSAAESLRTLHASLLLSVGQNEKLTLAVTSSVPGEGKTFVAISLGRHFAQSGQRCIVIEGDVRRSRFHKLFQLTDRTGLVHVLRGEKTLAEAIIIDPLTGCSILPAGKSTISAAFLFNTNQFSKLLDELKESFDVILIDTPPVVAVVDPLLISQCVDKVLFVVRWQDTPRNLILSARKKLTEFGIGEIGCVLSQVNIKRHAQYGYGDARYYYNRYGHEYTDK